MTIKQGEATQAPDAHDVDLTVELPPASACIHVRLPNVARAVGVGRILRDRYVIQERLDAGGEGTVFKALDLYRSSLPMADQFVGIKVLHTCKECSDQTLADLQRELNRGQRLSHPNIVNVYELDQDEGVVFLTMELLEGISLAGIIQRMRPSSMDPAQAWSLVRQIGSGLAHAHARGVVHGDLKPRNVFITSTGELRILDFGAARLLTTSGSPDAISPLGRVSLTPAYASCEQLEGRIPDPSDDLYSFACICYEMLTGIHPFASRPANLARDFRVLAVRPRGVTSRQWKTLQMGLSWHRAGRSISIAEWTRRLAGPHATPLLTPPASYKQRNSKPPTNRMTIAATACAIIVAAAAGVAFSKRLTSLYRLHPTGLTATTAAKAGDDSTAPHSAVPSAADRPAMNLAAIVPLSQPEHPAGSTAPVPSRPTLTVRYAPIGPHTHFVELTVACSVTKLCDSLNWWTEDATARHDVDYVQQSSASLRLPNGRGTIRLYVKLNAERHRAGREYFLVAIASPGIPTVTRVPVWLSPVAKGDEDRATVARR